METLGNNFVAFCGKKNVEKYNCELCNYICSKKYNWEKHLTTARHIKEADGNTLEIKSGKKWQKEQSTKLFMCEKCNKEFQTSSGLWKHKQKCKDITSTTNNNSDADEDDDDDVENIITDKKLILMLINQNKELMEIVKNGTNNTINNNNI